MKHRILALSIAVIGCQAYAQTTVNLTGIVDLAARHVDNEEVGGSTRLVSGSNSTSRLAFTGSEELTADLAASFHLEAGINATNGATTATDRFFDRRSTLSLSSKSMGELRMGRDYVPSYLTWSRFDPFSYVGVARSANLVSATPVGAIRSAFGSNANTTVRADTTLQWVLPGGLGGVEGGLLVTRPAGEDATAGQAKVKGLRLGWSGGPVVVAAGLTLTHNSLTTEGRFRDAVVGGQYQLDNIKLSAAWREFSYDQAKQALLMLGVAATFGPHEVKASWLRSNASGQVGATQIGGNDARQIGLGYLYNLSKRTALYTHVAQVNNEEASRLVISDGKSGMPAGGTSRGVEVGMRHRF